ncbi:MAG: GT4 family glycosyltransferase PelF [Lachnospiraceae bacterium]|nr:GT4 family glycosyltransferase PelF [Lachnospiraceae bacterium]
MERMMRICLILEGCYPYVHGGVSTWMHQYIQIMKEHEFVLWVIGAYSKNKGKFVYELPENVTEVHEIFLDDALRLQDHGVLRHSFRQEEKEALRQLMDCGKPDWEILFRLFQVKKLNPLSFLKSGAFLDILTEICTEQYPYLAFSDAFHTLRSMLLPVLYLLGSEVPKADVYHAISTGYGGLLASLGSSLYQKPLLLTEHGIYTREREEEIIRAQWVLPSFKRQWIRFFYMLSDLIYQKAFRVTSLFTNAMHAQIEMGCDPAKCRVIENGINYERLSRIPLKEEDGWVDIGAVVRLAPIKDIKTMIYAFYELSARVEKVRLHIMGGVDDEEYAQECYSLVEQMKLDNVIFTGRVDIVKYMEKLDFTILTSISEGQPLSVLESLAARRPCVTTEVGCCRELLEGREGDSLGTAGYCVPPMYREGLADAMEKMCDSRRRRLRMGACGQKRVDLYYRHERMIELYRQLYREVEETYGRNRI